MSMSPRKNESFLSYLFFFGVTVTIFSLLIIFVTIKNDCIYIRNEIYHLQNILDYKKNGVKIISAEVNRLSRRDRIEKIARENFNLVVPSPESLIVYLGEYE